MTDGRNSSVSPQPQAIAVSRLFSGVPETIREELTRAAHPVSIAKHARLFEQGDAGETMYLVQRGRIEISILSEAGRKIVLNHIPEGHCFGEVSMVDGQKRTASAIAVTPSVVLPITRQCFLKAARDCPQLAINLTEILCERLRWVSASVEEYALMSLDLRLARRLISLHARFGGASGNIAVTQSDLADHVGATRESTNKILMRWKDNEIVAMKRGEIQIRDMTALERIAHGELSAQA